MPTVSIISPTYNCADFIGETIESILNQRYGDFEYIIVDDGSTDETSEVLRQYNDPRIRILRQSLQGEIPATNAGLAQAEGRYVAVVSPDAPMLPFWLGEVVTALDRNADAVAAYPDWCIIDGQGYLDQIVRTPDYSMVEMAASFSAPAGPGTLIRKCAVDQLSPPRRAEFRSCADLDMWLRLSLIGRFVRVPKVLASRRSRPGSISAAERTERRANEIIALAHDFFSRPDLPLEVSAVKARGLACAHRLAAWVLTDTAPEEATRHEARAGALYPGEDLMRPGDDGRMW